MLRGGEVERTVRAQGGNRGDRPGREGIVTVQQRDDGARVEDYRSHSSLMARRSVSAE
jgi:hypothetical protein